MASDRQDQQRDELRNEHRQALTLD